MGGKLVNLLLDTHVHIWTQQDSPKLGRRTRKALLNQANDLWESSVSALEISRLVWGDRLELGYPVREWIQECACGSFDSNRVLPAP